MKIIFQFYTKFALSNLAISREIVVISRELVKYEGQFCEI
jgi:hypothetical protein